MTRRTVTAGRLTHAAGSDRMTWEPPVTLDEARQWARLAADGETIRTATFTHLDGSTSGMYVAAHGMARPNNHRHHHHR